MKKISFVLLFIPLIVMVYACNATKTNKHNNAITANYVPDEDTAIKIAEATWLSIYGEKIYNQKPYTVSLLQDSVWVVTGTLPPNLRGGVAYIEIRKKDGKILKVTHGR